MIFKTNDQNVLIISSTASAARFAARILVKDLGATIILSKILQSEEEKWSEKKEWPEKIFDLISAHVNFGVIILITNMGYSWKLYSMYHTKGGFEEQKSIVMGR